MPCGVHLVGVIWEAGTDDCWITHYCLKWLEDADNWPLDGPDGKVSEIDWGKSKLLLSKVDVHD
ncbi:hypothetical protein N7492_009442 [Penicillium capsulatum]|uniref:Uncharacterized protein n=1 Tax=Penicillium capsulatum TaxID=69766 RepID=A0A9W9HUI3_9EURO|nr:hypothetical protein N7492_009442 [Penicillium capsulatum]